MTNEAARQRDPAPPVTRGFEKVQRLWDPAHHRWSAKILPGEFFVTPHDESITAVLGSCVSVCIRDPALRVGGMNQFTLPADDRDGRAAQVGTTALRRLVAALMELGANHDRLKVKLFGGAKILSAATDVGAKNIAFVREFLRFEGLPVVAVDLGGNHPRRVMYFPNSGMSLVARLPALDVASVANREAQYLKSLGSSPIRQDLELLS